MADDRTYIKLHDGFDEHPKVAGLSDKEFRTYIEALCYCARNLTDGRISFAVARKLAPPRVFAALVDAGLFERHDDHFAVHDYLQHQRSAEQVKQLKAARREAGKRGGMAKANGLASARGVASDLLKQTPSKAVPDTEADTDRKTSSSTSSADEAFADFWSTYPRKTAKRKAESAWRSALKRADAQTILAGLRRFQFSSEVQFQPHPATWLNQDRWADQLAGPGLHAVGGGRTWSTSELETVLGPDMWRCPQPPAGMTGDEMWEWEQRVKREHRADRIRQAEAKLGRSA